MCTLWQNKNVLSETSQSHDSYECIPGICEMKSTEQPHVSAGKEDV